MFNIFTPSGRSVKPSGCKPDKDWIALFLKDITEISPDMANFRPDAWQTESDIQQFLRSLEAYKYGALGLWFVQNLVVNFIVHWEGVQGESKIR
jgi:hypothetical protein